MDEILGDINFLVVRVLGMKVQKSARVGGFGVPIGGYGVVRISDN